MGVILVAVIDSPDFMFIDENIDKYTFLKRLYIFLKGVLVGFIFKYTNQKTFCFFMNLLIKNQNKIFYKDNNYSKFILNNKLIQYPNKRIVRVLKNEKAQLNLLFSTYCLDSLNFSENDLVVDCGANIGELRYSFLNKDINIQYIAFEPEPKTFVCLKNNLQNNDFGDCYNIALSNESGKKSFYVDKEGGNSSLEYFGKNNETKVDIKNLDELGLKDIKLLKIEAEGHENEVLQGSVETLKTTNYVVVDYGPEKGVEQKSTASEVINFLYDNNFRLIETSKHRQVGLFKNQKDLS